MPRLFLTDDIVFSSNCPDGKDQEIYWDHPVGIDGRIRSGSISGLGLCVTALGHKSFVHAYQFNGKRYRKALGSTVVLNVASARLAVGERQRQLRAGESPDLDRIDPRRRHLLTVREAIDRYQESHIRMLSAGYQANFAVFVANWHRKAPKTPSRRGHNIRKPYADFGSLFVNHH